MNNELSKMKKMQHVVRIVKKIYFIISNFV